MTALVATAVIVAVAVLTALAVLQVAAAAGAPVGRFVWGGGHRVLPPRMRVGSAFSVLVYAGFAAVMLSRAGVIGGGEHPAIRVTMWVLMAYFALGIVLNGISRSRVERATMAPACAILAAASLVLAL